MNILLKTLLTLTFTAVSLFAMQKDTIKEEMTVEIEKVQKILKDKELKNELKKSKIEKVIDNVFDYKIMARIALGKNWKKISKAQRAEFSELFENKLKTSYIEKLDLYTDEEVKILDLTPYKKTRLQLKTQIIGQDDNYEVNYNFYNNKKKKEWLIYDVDIVGVSIIQTYRKQFAGLLKEKSLEEVLKILRK